LNSEQEWDLLERGLNRVTDTCIPEHEAFRRLQNTFTKFGKTQMMENVIYHMNLCTKCFTGVLEEYYEIDLKDSWMYAAAEKTYQLSTRMGR
jgi:deoxyhypusine synthase